ncbi:MAG: hypothetical protein AAB368_11700, partial [bacterium]
MGDMLPLNPGDVLPTGNEWVALPDLRAADGALGSFNVVSRSARGLLEVAGTRGAPLLFPFVETRGKRLRPAPWRWELVANWIPVSANRFAADVAGRDWTEVRAEAL